MQFRSTHIISTAQHVIHKYFIWVIILSYIIAAIYPSLGVHIRSIEVGSIDVWRTKFTVSLPPAMLAFLLFNAGLGVRTRELTSLLRNPSLLLGGALGNLFVPLAFVIGVSITMKLWHNSDETQQILTGLALVAAMPIAGASTAWAQNANGNLAVSLGLILLTTLCSPVLTPIVLHSVGFVTTGDYSEDLHELAADGAGGFLAAWVISPSLLGMLTHWILGEKRAALISPYLKLCNFGVLALLNYSNASISLPGVVSQTDPDFVVIMLIVVILLCLVMFGAGYLVSRAFRADRAGTASLMFGLGMNNNGAGLVLASMTLSDHPGVMLPIIFYNLIQHFVASLVDKILSRGARNRAAIH
ncbi:MAG: Na+-dependent transporter [Hyphomicrobiales bacterium]|nr:MAG: Na+-dependent transporter [Hyphomicrobiales bacterium]